jgi:hypothetical protein
MHRPDRRLIAGALLGLALLCAPSATHAQTAAVAAPATPGSVVAAPGAAAGTIRLVFDREVYRYAGANRRGPFRPLTSQEGMGPMYSDLSLRMIIYSDVPSESVAVLADGGKKTYRVRRGEVVGNATVVDIGPSRVVFTVEDFGVRRQEIMDLKANNQKEGA